jgi:tetratricopeptide (TPR) repeat protein
VAKGTGRRDPVALRNALIAALLEIPFTSALPERLLLVTLISRDARNFPEVRENTNSRLHVLEIVMTCMNNAGGLRALREALMTMAPEASGTGRVGQLIEGAALLDLRDDRDLSGVRELLRKAEASQARQNFWRDVLRGLYPQQRTEAGDLIKVFDSLAGIAHGPDVPPALLLVDSVAGHCADSLAQDLRAWVDVEAERAEVLDEVRAARRETAAHGPIGPLPPQTAPEDYPAQELADDTPSGSNLGELDDVTAADGRAMTEAEMNNGEMSDSVTFGATPDTEPAVARDDPPAESGPRPQGEKMAAGAPTTRLTERLPKVWGDVPQRNDNFTGREELLERLHEELTARRQTAVLPLHGMGGVGKSQLAVEYVYRHREDFDLVWWVPAEQPGQILDSLTRLAQHLKLDGSREANTAVPAVKEALSTDQLPYDRWLLVFDNAEDAKKVQEHFPSGGNGKILVTSRDPYWSQTTQVLEVDVFSRAESISFLKKRNEDLSEQNADELAEVLGDLPLAIEQAAAWRVATGMSVSEYLSLLESKRAELLRTSPSPEYEQSVAAAWRVSLHRLREVNEAALQLLQVFSFFAPEPIPRSLFEGKQDASITDLLDETLSDKFRLNRAIRDINRLALARVDYTANTVQIHRLVQAVVVDDMDDAEREVMRAGAHTLLANSNLSDPSLQDEWPGYQRIRPHVVVSRAVESPKPRVQKLVFDLAQFIYHWGDHTGSEELAEEAYKYRVQDLGETDRHTLNVAKWLGWMRWINGKYDEARELNQQTLGLYREAYGDEHRGTIDAMILVSTDLRTSGDFAAALAMDERAFGAAVRAADGDEAEPLALQCAHSMGVSLRLAGDFQRAAQIDERTYERRKEAFGPNHTETLNTLNGWIIDIRESGRYIEARDRQEQVYGRHLEAFGPDSPWTLRAARSLAVAYRKAGEHELALNLAQQTLDKFDLRYGDAYPETIATALNFAVDLRHAAKFEASRELGEDTLAQYSRVFGERHSYTLSARTNLAIVLRLTGEKDAAYELDRRAVDGLMETLGPDHAVTLTCATNLASDLYARGDYQAAYERDIDTLARSGRVLGAEHPSTLACGVNLVLDLRALSRDAEADRILADTMVKFRRVLGDKHPATLNALQHVRADCDVDPMPL